MPVWLSRLSACATCYSIFWAFRSCPGHFSYFQRSARGPFSVARAFRSCWARSFAKTLYPKNGFCGIKKSWYSGRKTPNRVRARPNPILGAVVEAEVVLRAGTDVADSAALKKAIIAHCRPRLAAHKVPASVRFVDELPITSGGKLVRRGA